MKEPPFDEWLLGERERLRELAKATLGKLLAHQLTAGIAEPAIRTAMRILMLDPASETAHRELMRLFERQGRRAEALRQYRLCVDALQRELGVEPQQETRRLYQDLVRAGRVSPAHADARPAAPKTNAASGPPELLGDLARLSMPLLGRDAELARLFQALDASGRGAGRLVVVLGEAGIGKSSLLEALETAARRRGVACSLGRSYLSEQVLPFAPWIEALRAAGVVGHARLQERLGPAWIDELARLIPDLGARSSERAGDTGPQRLFEAVARLVSCLADERPWLIMLEDVHWADEMSLRLLAFVARRIPLLREAVEQVAQGRRTREALFTTYLAEALLLAREVTEASALAEGALALSRERFEQATEARALYVLGETVAHGAGRDGPAGEPHYQSALALAGELGLRPLVAQCHLGLARLERARTRTRGGPGASRQRDHDVPRDGHVILAGP